MTGDWGFTPGFHARIGWGRVTQELRKQTIEESGMICALCGEYCDANYVLHHLIYRKGPCGEPRDAKPGDVVVVHNRPQGWCTGHTKDLPYAYVIEE